MATALDSEACITKTQPPLFTSQSSPSDRGPPSVLRNSNSPEKKRPLTAISWALPPSSVSPKTPRPATAIGWEDWKVSEAAEQNSAESRRYSTGTKVPDKTSKRARKSPDRKMGGKPSSETPSEDTDSPQTISHLTSFLDIVQSKQKVKEKFRQLMRRLLHENDSINSMGEDNMTPLHYAVLNGEELCVKALVAFGANINAKNSFNQTPLDIACENQQDHLVPLLVSIGCLNGRNIPNVSPHHPTRRRAVSSPHEVPGCSKIHSPKAAQCKKFTQKFEYASCSSEEAMKRADSDLSEQMEMHIDQRFEATQSLKPDEAFAMVLQKQEIAKFKSKCSSTPPRDHSCISMPLQAHGCASTPPPDHSCISTPPQAMVQHGCTPARPRPMISTRGGNRILSLDGGGIRALIQIDVLCEMERETGKKITELFDWIIGTSAGGIIALALVYQQMSLSRLRDLFFRLKDEVFSKGRVGFCYDSIRLEELLKEEFGTEMRMNDISHPKVLVCAVDKSSIPLKLNFFNNCFHDEFSQQFIWKVARYTTAAPMYFTECDNYVDGGVMANNPCIDAVSKIQSFYAERNIHLPITCLVSVGSGISPSQELGSVDFHVFLRLKFSGMLKKAQSLITMLSSAIGESEALAERCRTSCEVQNIPFFRFNPQLGEKIDPGCTNNLKLLQMIITSRIYIHTQESQVQKLLPLLSRTAESAR